MESRVPVLHFTLSVEWERTAIVNCIYIIVYTSSILYMTAKEQDWGGRGVSNGMVEETLAMR